MILCQEVFVRSLCRSPSVAVRSRVVVAPLPAAVEDSRAAVVPLPAAVENSRAAVVPLPAAAEDSRVVVALLPAAVERSRAVVVPLPAAGDELRGKAARSLDKLDSARDLAGWVHSPDEWSLAATKPVGGNP